MSRVKFLLSLDRYKVFPRVAELEDLEFDEARNTTLAAAHYAQRP